MKVIKFDNNFSDSSINNKKNYIKSLISVYDIKLIINSLVINNSNIEENFEIVNYISKTKVFKEINGLKNIELISLLIDYLIKQNRTKELFNYLKNLDLKEQKRILTYEIEHETNFSKLKLFKGLNKDNSNIKYDKKIIDDDNNKNKKSSVKVTKTFLIILLFLVISYMFVGYCYSSIFYYNNHVYPNIYIDDLLIENMNHDELKSFLKEKEEKLNSIVKFKNNNDTYTFSYKDIGFSVNTKEVEDSILNITNNLNGFQKLYKILTRKEYHYKIEYSINDNSYNEFIDNLRNSVNVSKQKESFRIINGKISYQRGINGFTLDETGLKDKIISSINEENSEINLNGNVDGVTNSLGSINKKVSTFTTYYNEAQGRAKNIRNAVSKLNGTIVYPGNIFSFYRVAGPYNGSRGYIFYAKDVGSGVCQVSTTIYNAALLINMPIVARENHGDMVYYVDYGMDATVYGSSVDFKFKNSSNYPIYIEASAYGGTLTVSFWSNENIVEKGYTYKPRVERLGGLGFKTYLDTYYNGNFVSSKYLNSSYYLKGK